MIQAAKSPVRPPAGTTDVLIAIPAYNEDRYIGSLVAKLRLDGYEVLVIDDGSSDLTGAIAESAGAMVIHHVRNGGKAAGVRSALDYARGHDVQVLVLMDGDSQHEPAEVTLLVDALRREGADMVVGSRYAGANSRIPGWRRVGQHALTLATNLGSGSPTTDSQSGFRAFSRRAIETMQLRRRGFSVESEMQFEASARGLVIRDVPIHVHYEIPLKRSPVRQGLDVLDSILRLIAQHRPLLFFGVPGLLVLLAGLALGWHVVQVYEATLTLAVGYALVTVLLCIVGMLSVFVGLMLHAINGLVRSVSQQRDERPDA